MAAKVKGKVKEFAEETGVEAYVLALNTQACQEPPEDTFN